MSAWLSSTEQKRSFDFFLNRAGTRLGGFFNASFWSREVLQAAINYPSIRHLVVALGAVYEQYEVKDHDIQQSHFPLQECNRSISHITRLVSSSSQSPEDLYCIITASILFATFASLQGHVSQAINHIRSGLKVLRSLDSCGFSSNFPIPLPRLRLYLTNLYAQVRTIINDEALAEWDGQDPLSSKIEPVSSFLSLSDAHNHVEALYNNTLAFLQTTVAPQSRSTSIERKERREADHQTLTSALRSSCDALDSFLGRHTDQENEKAIAILHLHHTLLSVRLGVSVLGENNRESLFDDLEQKLVQILKYCQLVLQTNDTVASKMQPVFSSGLGVIMPLHTVAARCRNPLVRQEAIDLLRKAQRREGLWDSALVEKIVSTTVELEEKGDEMPHSERGVFKVPDNDRVREVKIYFKGDRSARVVFVTVEQWRNNEKGHQRFLDW
jgi:hypothetical protein